MQFVYFNFSVISIMQCLKLRFQSAHLPCATTRKMVHSAINSCVAYYENLVLILEKHTLAGCTKTERPFFPYNLCICNYNSPGIYHSNN